MGKGLSLGGIVSSIFGSDNDQDATAQQGAPEVDPNAYNYGGAPGGAAAKAGDYNQRSWGAQYRTGPNIDTTNSAWDRSQAGQARVGQQTLADAMGRRALGQVPSIAEMQGQRQRRLLAEDTNQRIQQARAAQGGMQASARSPAGIALAGQTAAGNVANSTSAIANQGTRTAGDIANNEQINAANERLQAEQAGFGAYSGMRQGDQSQGALSAQQAQAQAQLENAQRQRNDQMTMGYSQLENQVNTTQLGAQMNQQAQASANKLGAAGINAGVGGQNAAMNQANATGVIGLGASVAGGGATGSGGKVPPTRAAGGPIEGQHSGGGEPYIVGKHGPELIVPKHDGMVIPADRTAQLLGALPRAGGGPVSGLQTWGKQPDVPNTYDWVEPAPPEGAVPATWGTKPDVNAQGIARGNAADAAAAFHANSAPLLAYKNPYQRDVDEVTKLQALNPDLVDDADVERLRRGKAMLGLHDKEQKKSSAEEKKSSVEAPKSFRQNALGSLASAMGDMSKVDTSYHGGHGYVAPHLITVGGSRAMGGPVEAGGAPVPDFTAQIQSLTGFQPMGPGPGQQLSGPGMSGADVRAASTGLAGAPMRGMVTGGGVTGGMNVPGGALARAMGGPTRMGHPYLVGEKGPELVIPREGGGPISGTGDPSIKPGGMMDPPQKGTKDPEYIDLDAYNEAVNRRRPPIFRRDPSPPEPADQPLSQRPLALQLGGGAILAGTTPLLSLLHAIHPFGKRAEGGPIKGSEPDFTDPKVWDQIEREKTPYSNEAAIQEMFAKQPQPKSVRVDSPADQRAVKDAYYKDLMRQAASRIEAFDPQLAAPAAVKGQYAESLGDAPPDWLEAYMAQQRAPSPMVAAMRSSKPSSRVMQRHRNSAGDLVSYDDWQESLGSEGALNQMEPDYNFVAHPSPLNVDYAFESNPNAISPETEAYMRREGKWGPKTDALLKQRGRRK